MSVPTDWYPDRRYLFSHKVLGLDNFNRQQVFVRDSLGSDKDSFIGSMKACYDSSQVPYLKDLSNLVAAIETEEELEWTIELVKRYYRNFQGSEVPYRFGPPLLRAVYLHNRTDLVLSILHDPDLVKYLNQNATYVLGFDLLFENGYYEDILTLQQDLEYRDDFEYNSLTLTLALAALYKINGPDCVQKALHFVNIIENTMEKKLKDVPASILNISALIALKQNDLQTASDLICKINKPIDFSYNIQLIILAKMGRFDEIGVLLKTFNLLRFGSTLFYSETVEALEKEFQEASRHDLYKQLQSMKQAFPALFTLMRLENCILKSINIPSTIRNSQKHKKKTKQQLNL